MKILELANALKAIYDAHGDVEVLFCDPNHDDGPFAVGSAKFCIAEDGEFPDDFDMPAGFEFVVLDN